MNIWEWDKSVKIFLSHVNAHQRASTKEEDLNSQVDKITPLYPVISYSSAGSMGTQIQWPWWDRWMLYMGPTAWVPTYQA